MVLAIVPINAPQSNQWLAHKNALARIGTEHQDDSFSENNSFSASERKLVQ